MENIINKISSYNLFNYLLPGILFVVITKYFTQYSFIQNDVIIGAFVYYFIGLVISRIGSLVIEPMFKKIKFLKFTDYKDFVSASKIDSKIDILSEANNTYRTLCSLFLLLLLFRIYQLINDKFQWLNYYNPYILLGLLFIMFLFAYRKQTKYITKRIGAILTKTQD